MNNNNKESEDQGMFITRWNCHPTCKLYSLLILGFHTLSDDMRYNVVIISIGRNLPLQIDHCKRICVGVPWQVQNMPHVATAQVLFRNCDEQIASKNRHILATYVIGCIVRQT